MMKPLPRRMVIHSPWPRWNWIPPPRSCQAMCLALRMEQFLAGGPVRSGGAHGDQDGGGVEDQFPALSQQPASLGHPAGRSHHKLAPHSEMARSKLPEGSGTAPVSASTSGKVMPDRSWQRRGLQLGGSYVDPGRPRPSASPPRIPATCPCHDKHGVHRPPRPSPRAVSSKTRRALEPPIWRVAHHSEPGLGQGGPLPIPYPAVIS